MNAGGLPVYVVEPLVHFRWTPVGCSMGGSIDFPQNLDMLDVDFRSSYDRLSIEFDRCSIDVP